MTTPRPQWSFQLFTKIEKLNVHKQFFEYFFFSDKILYILGVSKDPLCRKNKTQNIFQTIDISLCHKQSYKTSSFCVTVVRCYHLEFQDFYNQSQNKNRAYFGHLLRAVLERNSVFKILFAFLHSKSFKFTYYLGDFGFELP